MTKKGEKHSSEALDKISTSVKAAWRRRHMKQAPIVMRGDGSISAMKPSDLKEVAERDARVRQLERLNQSLSAVVEAAQRWRHTFERARSSENHRRLLDIAAAVDNYEQASQPK